MSERMQSQTRQAPKDDPVLEVRNAEVTFEMARGHARVLDDISIDIQRGETLGIVGESGCGKSMFGSIFLDGVKDPGILTGEIRYHPENGESVDILDLGSRDLKHLRWEEVAIMYQGAMSAFNPVQNIRTHFVETLTEHNEDKEEGMEHARELLRKVNLEPERVLNAYQHELSGGEKQRVMLALALILDPEVLILDEPTAALDLHTQRIILNLLHDLKEEYDLTLVFITHDLPIVAGIADRLAVMYAFEIVELGDSRDVLMNPEHPYTRSLLRSTMGLDQSIDDIATIPGDTPDPVNIPLGCPFHPRCPIARDRCEAEKPDLRVSEEGHRQVACFYPDVSKSEISVPSMEEE